MIKGGGALNHDFDIRGDPTSMPDTSIGMAICHGAIGIKIYAVDGETAARIVEEIP